MIEQLYKEKLIDWQKKKTLDINLIKKYPRFINKTGFLKISVLHSETQKLPYNYFNHIKFFLAKYFVGLKIGFIINDDEIKNQLYKRLFQYEHAEEKIKDKINTYIKNMESQYLKKNYPVEFLQGSNIYDLVYVDGTNKKQYIKIQKNKKKHYTTLKKISEEIYNYSQKQILSGCSKVDVLKKATNRLIDYLSHDITTTEFISIIEKYFLKSALDTKLKNRIAKEKQLFCVNTGDFTFKMSFFTFRLKFDESHIFSKIKVELIN